jgi:pimeloyl-ACP methyl ester carboxylesterase
MIGLLGLAAVGAASAVAVPAWVWARFAWYVRHKGGKPPGLGTAVRAFAGEAVQASRLVRYGVASALRGDPPHDPGAGPTVVCVHGYTMNGSNFRALRAALAELGCGSRTLSLGWPGRRVAHYAPRLAALLERTPGPIDVVAHSMGGVVLRVVLRENPHLASRIRRIATLGTPHAGTAGARGWLRIFPEPADLHRSSRLLAGLPHLAALAPTAEILTVGSALDLVVYPRETATSPGAQHLEVDVGHLGLVVDPRVARLVARWLAAPPAPPTGNEREPGPAGG